MNEAARLLRNARRRTGLTQRQVAAKAGVPQSYVARIESSRLDPSVSSLSRLLRACATTLEAMPGSGEGVDRTLFRRDAAEDPRMTGSLAALRALADHDVRFVLIGGHAGLVHGSSLVTRDVDVCYDRDPGNLGRLTTALHAMHARLRGVDEDVPFVLDARTLCVGDSFTFETDHGAVDVLATPSGTRGYPDLAAGATRTDLGGFEVDVCSLDDLIRMKRATGRLKDSFAVEVLLALRDEIEGR